MLHRHAWLFKIWDLKVKFEFLCLHGEQVTLTGLSVAPVSLGGVEVPEIGAVSNLGL